MSSKIEINYIKQYRLCDKDHFAVVKGISILAALAAYIFGTYWDIPHMYHIRKIAAVVFALCSGYGLSESFRRKGGLIHYWENRMLKTWLPSLVVMVAFSLFLKGSPFAWVTQSPLGLKGSFVQVIFGAYIAFWVVFQFAEKTSSRMVGLFAIAGIAFCVISEDMGIKVILPAFPLGVLFSQLGLKYKVREFAWKGKVVLMLICSAAGIGSWLLASRIAMPYVSTALWSICYAAVAAVLIFGTYYAQKLPIFGVFVPFGMASYALYLLYDYVFYLIVRQTSWRMIGIAFAALCVAAAILTVLRELLVAWNQKLRRKKSPHLKGAMWH